MCVTWWLFISNNIATAAALTEVFVLLSAILVSAFQKVSLLFGEFIRFLVEGNATKS